MSTNKKLRIAIMDPNPHICGPSVYVFAVQEGMKRLGHHCDVIGFTKSGKEPIGWEPDARIMIQQGTACARRGPDLVGKWDGAAEILNTYDGVILAEPRCILHDKAALKDNATLPVYGEVLRDLKKGVPWTSYFPCPQYGEKAAPYLGALLNLATFSGYCVASDTEYVPQSTLYPRPTIVVDDLLPYVPIYDLNAPFPTGKVIGTCGRLVPNKGGWTNILSTLSRFPTSWLYEIWGAAGKGLGPSVITVMREFLDAAYGLESFTWDAGERYASYGVMRVDPFKAVLKTGHRVEFRGGYKSIAEAHAHLSVLVNLSSKSYTSGVIEYVGLEALDAGCELITATHQGGKYHDRFSLRTLKLFSECRSVKSDGTAGDKHTNWQDVEDEFVALVCNAMDCVERDDGERAKRILHNRAVIRELHAPENHASNLICALNL